MSYFNEDVDSKEKKEKFYAHNGLIKVLENDKKITTGSSVYYINSKCIENGIIIYCCTGKDVLMNDIPIRIEYDKFFNRVKICNDNELTERNYSVYFLTK